VTAPSYEQLAALVAAQERMIAQLQARIAEQDAEIAELKRQLAASSRNSSKPPSTDGLDKPAPKSLRGRSGRKPGGQPGRQGRTLRQVAVPDEVVVYESDACTGCGGTLTADSSPAGMIRRQVFDIPVITVRVVEHRLISRRCSCGTVTGAAAPAGVTAPVQYGPHTAAIAVYLVLGQHLPVQRTAALLAEVFGTPMATGTVAAWTARAARAASKSGMPDLTCGDGRQWAQVRPLGLPCGFLPAGSALVLRPGQSDLAVRRAGQRDHVDSAPQPVLGGIYQAQQPVRRL
jgi:transposase